MLAAIILAAGNSSRMGRPKALLEYGGGFFIENVCAALRSAGVDERVVVLGRDAGAIISAWDPFGEKIVVNPEPDLGQMSSLRVGLAAAGPAAEGFMVCLADQPAIRAETYKAVIAFWASHKDAVVIPRCLKSGPQAAAMAESSVSGAALSYKRGHPIVIPALCRHLCFEGPLDKGLHWVTHHPSVKISDLTVEDRGIIRDFDTPEDYAALVNGHPR